MNQMHSIFLRVFLVSLLLLATSCRLPGSGETQTGCEPPTLEISETVYEIETIQPKNEGSIDLPEDQPRKAYWVDGTDIQYIFLLNPTNENISLIENLSPGKLAQITWSNCNSMTFTLAAPQPASFDTANPSDPSIAGIAIYIQPDPGGEGLVVTGDVSGGEISAFNTPDLDRTEVQAEISIEESRVSSEGKTVQVRVSIYNFGERDIKISSQDIALLPTGSDPISLTESEPALPHEIAPAITESFLFTFPLPDTSTAVLRIFTVEYEIDF